MIVSPTFSLVGVGVWRVGDGRPFGVLCVVWGALAAVAAAGTETAQNCKPYRVNPDTSTLPVYMDANTTVDLTVKTDGTRTQESQTVLNLSVGSETIELLVGDREAQCNVGRHRSNEKVYNITEEGKEGLYRFFVYNKTLYINGIGVCKNVNIGTEDVSLKVERASVNVIVIFNCVSDYNCNFDNGSLTLDPATAKGTSYVRTLSRGATADIEVFDCLDEARTNLAACDSLITDTLKREDIEGEAYKGNWQRLHFRTDYLKERDEDPERSIDAVLLVGDYLKVFEFKNSPVLVINNIKGMEFATNCNDSFPSLRLSFEKPAEVPSADDSVEKPANDGSAWLYVAVALLVLLALVVIFGVAACCRLRRKVASQELEALGQPSAYTHPALSSSPSPSLAEAKSRHNQRYSTLLASDAVAVPNGHSKSGGGGHLSGRPDLAPPPLPSTSPPSLPHHPDGASPPAEAVDVRRTLERRDNSCHADAKGPQETPWSSADDGEDNYADPEELETPPWLRIQGADDDEEHDYADPRELEKPAWLLAQDADDDGEHDYDYIDRDALKVQLDREETQRKSAAAEEARLSRHDSENSLYEEMKVLEAASESRAREEQRQREQRREERELQTRQERQEVEEQQQRDEKEKRQQMEEEEQDQNEQIQHNQADELKDSEQELLEWET